MGAWSYGPFDNDEAGDWMDEFEERGLDAIESALDAALEQDYVELTEGSAAVAAAAIVATVLDEQISLLPEDSRPRLLRYMEQEKAFEKYRERSIKALDRVLAADSELAELWSQAEGFSKWRESVINLRKCLNKIDIRGENHA